ncbi:MAG: CBS domain-containing protein, partial [Gemmatimonadales bacterium]
MKHAPILTARDIMARNLVTLRPEMSIMDAIEVMLRKRISGAPVIDDDYRILGMLSEYDLLRVLASGEYSAEDYEQHDQVGVWMTTAPETISPNVDIYRLAHLLLERGIRRLP